MNQTFTHQLRETLSLDPLSNIPAIHSPALPNPPSKPRRWIWGRVP